MQMDVNRTPSSFLCHDGGGVTSVEVGWAGDAVSGAGSWSTQGSKISKPEGCVEDGEGGCSGRVLAVAVAFVPVPIHQDPPEKITEQPDSSQLPALRPRLAGTGKQMLELQQGVRMIPARHPHAARRPHNTSSSHSLSLSPSHTQTHTHPAEAWGPQAPHAHTRLSLEWLSKMDTHSAKLDEHKRFQLNYPHSFNVLLMLKWAEGNPLLGSNGGLNFLSRGRSFNSPPE